MIDTMFILLLFIKVVMKGNTNNNLDSSLPYLGIALHDNLDE